MEIGENERPVNPILTAALRPASRWRERVYITQIKEISQLIIDAICHGLMKKPTNVYSK